MKRVKGEDRKDPYVKICEEKEKSIYEENRKRTYT
jgi:hypothetical protein